MAMPAAVMLQRSKSIRASPLLGSFLGRLLPGAAPVGSCQLREISPLPLVYSSIVPSHVRHYVSYKEAYFSGLMRKACGFLCRFNPSARTNWGIQIVPKNNVFVVERLGKYFKTLNPGIHMLIPVVDRIAYVHSLMEEEIAISNQSFMTKDNINILIVDPYLASYGVDNPIFTAASVGRASLQRELGKIALEKAQSFISKFLSPPPFFPPLPGFFLLPFLPCLRPPSTWYQSILRSPSVFSDHLYLSRSFPPSSVLSLSVFSQLSLSRLSSPVAPISFRDPLPRLSAATPLPPR
ncbi:hypothetical protein Taro_041694 [Colocasia esculenta]|uniref:Band 7 domain-containing protein n=1 Tax=Colocasia esculenta TaxID=4460 RepID=A0A843X112_COLES|nr:hypothetical protein [Colocasia esculenta]